MADMEETTAQSTSFEEDPAADFLAREQDDLADIAEDTLGFVSVGQEFQTEQEQVIPSQGDIGEFLTADTEQEVPIMPADPYSAVSHMDTMSSEPECIRAWREQQQEMLATKDAEESAALDELRAQARKELADWYSRHDDQVGQTKTSNRQAEEAFVEERDEEVPGHEWERVARLCDFNPKHSKNTKDISRMRTIFLQLKQTPLVRD